MNMCELVLQPTTQMCVASTKIRAPTMTQQLMNRYRNLQKEKEELLKK